ncbi:unnamed protein product [Closterium sp. NIES-53]
MSCAASPATSRVTQEPIVLPLPPPSSHPAIHVPVPDLACAASPIVPRCLATLVTAHASLTAAVSASSCPPFVGGELALGCDVLEDRHFELEYLPYPLSIQTRYVVPKRHHPAHWRAARRVLRYLARLVSRT